MKKIASIHDGPAVCGRIGSKSGLAAISSPDECVSVYPTSGPGTFKRIAHLTDHPSVVKTVCWGDPHSEQKLVAGCSSGSVWLWDIATETQVSSFAGHRSTCLDSAYHPFGQFFATASEDTNIKIWDARSGKCIQTYRSHACGVSAIRFSPHGRWLASGDAEGALRVFDLSSGKELCCLESHRESITCIDFHPTDFFFISSSTDRTIKLWSCEGSFNLAATSEPEQMPVEIVKFNQRGNGLCVATNAGVKQFELDNQAKRIACTSSDITGWENLLDIVVTDEESLMGIASDESSNSISVYVWVNAAASERPAQLSPVRASRPVVNRRQESVRPDTSSCSSQRSDTSAEALIDPKKENTTASNRGGIKDLLTQRLLTARQVGLLWQSGNTKAAIDEVITASDPTSFISVLGVIGSDRNRSNISVETCTNILRAIVDEHLLSFPCSPSENWAALLGSGEADISFVAATVVAATLSLIKRFGPTVIELKRASQAARIPGTDLAREDRLIRAVDCLDQIEQVAEIVRDDLRHTKLLRREKEALLTEISSLIQP